MNARPYLLWARRCLQWVRFLPLTESPRAITGLGKMQLMGHHRLNLR